jgi:acetolactate synthase-1/2/3 large subunit
MPRDAMLVLDSGLHQQLARRYHRVLAPRGLLAPSDFQSMGFGIPAAIGAALSSSRRSVVALVGDGGFVASGLDLATAARERVPITVIVFVDGALGLIRQQQIREFGHAHGTEVASLDLRAFAGAVGADYLAFAGPEGAAALRDAIASDRVTLVEIAVGGSIDFAWLHAKGAAKAAVRRVVPRSLLERLKRGLQ